MSEELKKFLAERDRILREVDVAAARKAVPEVTSDEAALVMIHKVRFDTRSMPDHLRHASREWLETHGYNRLRQLPWPPKGVLER